MKHFIDMKICVIDYLSTYPNSLLAQKMNKKSSSSSHLQSTHEEDNDNDAEEEEEGKIIFAKPYTPAATTVTTSTNNKRTKSMKDKNAPKPALNSYMIFMQLKLNEVKEKKLYPDKPQKDLMAIFGSC